MPELVASYLCEFWVSEVSIEGKLGEGYKGFSVLFFFLAISGES